LGEVKRRKTRTQYRCREGGEKNAQKVVDIIIMRGRRRFDSGVAPTGKKVLSGEGNHRGPRTFTEGIS